MEIIISRTGVRWVATCKLLDCAGSGFSREAAVDNLIVSINSTIKVKLVNKECNYFKWHEHKEN